MTARTATEVLKFCGHFELRNEEDQEVQALYKAPPPSKLANSRPMCWCKAGTWLGVFAMESWGIQFLLYMGIDYDWNRRSYKDLNSSFAEVSSKAMITEKLLYFVWSPPWHLYILLLAYLLAFYLAYLLADVLAYLLADVLAYLLAYLLAYVLAYLLAFHLAFYLAYLLALYVAYLLAWILAVEVRQGTLDVDGRGWGPAGNTGPRRWGKMLQASNLKAYLFPRTFQIHRLPVWFAVMIRTSWPTDWHM